MREYYVCSLHSPDSCMWGSGSHKDIQAVLILQEGEGKGQTIEAVLIPIVREAGGKPRITLCVSSQVLACLFSRNFGTNLF